VTKAALRIYGFVDIELPRDSERVLVGKGDRPHLPKGKIPGILNANALRFDQSLHSQSVDVYVVR